MTPTERELTWTWTIPKTPETAALFEELSKRANVFDAEFRDITDVKRIEEKGND